MRRNKAPGRRVESGGSTLPPGEKQHIENLVNSGQPGQARKAAERLCRKYRNDPQAWFLLGAVCGSEGDYVQAVNCCRRTTQLAPQVAIGHFNLGVALNRAGLPAEAVGPLRKALELQPAMPDAYRELGSVYAALGDYDHALEAFSGLVRLQPGDSAVWIALGNLFEKKANFPEAERCYRKSLEVDRHSVAARMNLGNVLKSLERMEEAEQCYLAVLEQAPDNTDVVYNLAVLYQSMCRYVDAESGYRKVLELEPAHIPALNNLGLVLMAQSRLDEAVGVFTELLQKQPDNFDAMRNLSTVFREKNRLDLAGQQLNNILSVDHENIPARQDRSLVWLQQGVFDKGWDEYEWRNADVDLSERWPFPVWDGEPVPESTVLVYPEQGVGDEIMFASCVRDVVSVTGKVILVCDQRLEPVFQRSFPDVRVIGRKPDDGTDWLDALPHVDMQVSVASLPKFFRRHRKDFPVVDGYLEADPKALEKWQLRYAGLGDGLKVGLSWRGGHLTNTQLKRSIPLEQWADILLQPGVCFVNLQYGDCAAELELVQERHAVKVHDWPGSDPLVDMDDFSAKVQALDLVISIDNSTVHLAGALGVQTWILQPFSPDWRWLTGQDSSYWYQSVKMYRQASPGQWDTVLGEVADALFSARHSG